MTSLELINRTQGPTQREDTEEKQKRRQWISGETRGMTKKVKKTQRRGPPRKTES